MDIISQASQEMAMTVSKSLAELFVNKLLDIGRDVKLLTNTTRALLVNYLIRAYDNYSSLNTVAFNSIPVKLKDIYYPLTLTNEKFKVPGTVSTEHKIDSNPVSIFGGSTHNIMIVDDAGMGKSTLMRYLFVFVYENGEYGVPIFLELRNIDDGRHILDLILDEINNINGGFDMDTLTKMIENGGFVFFLDGFDEVESGRKTTIAKEIASFISKAGNYNSFFLTSRPGEDALIGIQNMLRFGIRPLAKEESYELIKLYCTNSKMSESIISEISKTDAFDEFLSNPLLISLLVSAYEYDMKIPEDKVDFYRQIFYAFARHDKTKSPSFSHNINTGLDTRGMERLFSYLGFSCMENGMRTCMSLGDIYEAVKRFNLLESKAISPINVIKDITLSVPLFVESGLDSYRWQHKSLMEYFSAMYIKDADDKKDIFKAIFEAELPIQYFNIISILQTLDHRSNEDYLLLPFLNEFISICENNQLNDYEMVCLGAMFVQSPRTLISYGYRLAGICRVLRKIGALEHVLSKCDILENYSSQLIGYSYDSAYRHSYSYKHKIAEFGNTKFKKYERSVFKTGYRKAASILGIDVHSISFESMIPPTPKIEYIDYNKCRNEILRLKELSEHKQNKKYKF